MAAEGWVIEELGVRATLVSGVVASPGMNKDPSCLGDGLIRIGGAGVMLGIGITGAVLGKFACGAPGMTGAVWGMFGCGAPLRAGVCWGIVKDGRLALGDGVMLGMGGSEGNISGEDKDGSGEG